MKYKFILLGLIAIAFLGCQERIMFSEPQPSDKKDKNNFKRGYRGTYLNLSDSSLLVIEPTIVYQNFNAKVVIHIDEIQENGITKIDSNSFEFELFNGDIQHHLKGDSLFIHYSLNDTIFQLSDQQILRVHKGNYFLNYNVGPNAYEVKLMQLNSAGILEISELLVQSNKLEDLNQVLKLPELENDSVEIKHVRINPTKKELKDIVRNGVFTTTGEYQKIN